MDFEEDIGSIRWLSRIYKFTGRGECHKYCGSCFKIELVQYSNGSLSRVRRRQKVFPREEFMKGGNPTVSQLLNLADEMIQPKQMLKKFILNCTDSATTNIIGCNDNFLKGPIEEHSTFWRIFHQLELAMKESVGKGLLNDIKKCLIN